MPFTNLKKSARILALFFKFVNGILRNWESLCDIRPDCHHHFDASGTSNAMFDELAERSLMSPLAGTKHTYVRLAIIIYWKVKSGFCDLICFTFSLLIFFQHQEVQLLLILTSTLWCPLSHLEKVRILKQRSHVRDHV